MSEHFTMGGQALMEGVMMNGPHFYTATVRKPDGSLAVTAVRHTTEDSKWSKIPLIRGIISFVRSLMIGIRALDFSSEAVFSEGETTDDEENKTKQTQMGFASVIGIVLGIALAIGLFLVLPVLLSKWVFQPFISATWLLTICEGVIRLAVFFLYLGLISLIPDIRRTFEYHGAEHKVVALYESGEALTVENARKFSRLNRRCGTSFIFIIMIIGIIVFMFIPIANPVFRIIFKILLLPLILGISYEILKASAKYSSKLLSVLVMPGLWFQLLTTKEPDDAQIETALNSAILILMKEGLPVPEGSMEVVAE